MAPESTVACDIAGVPIGSGRLALIAGPCLAESLELCLTVAGHLADLCRRLAEHYASARRPCECGQTMAYHVATEGLDADWHKWF